MVSSLRGFFGLESEELLRFGIKPRVRDIRRKTLSTAAKAEQLAEDAAKAASSAAAEANLKAAQKAMP